MKLIIATTMALGSILLLALPVQLHGLPGHLRTHDGAVANNQELENAVVQALLAMSQLQYDSAEKQQHNSAKNQHSVAENQQWSQQYTSVNVQQAILQQVMKETARNQMICQRRLQQAASQQISEVQQYYNSEAQCYEALAQQSGITIEYCGAAGDIIQNALRFGLGFIPGGENAYGVYIACAEQPKYPCTTVTVAVPANSIKADIDVCDHGNNHYTFN